MIRMRPRSMETRCWISSQLSCLNSFCPASSSQAAFAVMAASDSEEFACPKMTRVGDHGCDCHMR